MILVDTNILIEIYRNNRTIIAAVEAIGQNNIAVSSITFAELLYGARNKKELQLMEVFVARRTLKNVKNWD